MSAQCKVSVLITFYNQAQFVERALESVLGQDIDFPIEVLVGDDGSNDGTREIVERFQQQFPGVVRLFCWEREEGEAKTVSRASRNRFRLAEQAKGEYLTFLDGDDYYTEAHKLAQQVRALDEREDCVSCAHNMRVESSDGALLSLGIPEWVSDGQLCFETYWSLFYLHAESFLFRRDRFAQSADKIDIDNFDDNSIVFSLASSGPIFYLSEPMIAYTQNEDSVWDRLDAADRTGVNLRDCAFEIAYDPAMRDATLLRHRADLYRCVSAAADGRESIRKKMMVAPVDKTSGLPREIRDLVIEGAIVNKKARLAATLSYLGRCVGARRASAVLRFAKRP